MNCKRILTLLLVLVMVLSMAACGGETVTPTDPHNPMSKEEMLAAENKPAEEAEKPVLELNHDTKVSLLADAEIEAMKAEPMYEKGILIYFAGGNCTSAPYMAQRMGLYEQYGIKTEIVAGGGFVEALGTNAAQVTVSHISTMLVPITNGVNYSFVGGAHIGCLSMYVLGDSEIQSIDDLKGKNIGVSGIGEAPHNVAIRMFGTSGMDPKTDFTPVVTEMSAAVVALQNGEIDALVTSDMWAYDMVKDGTLRVVRSLYDEDFAQDPCCVLAMNNDFMKENPMMAKAAAECVKLAGEWMRENPEEAIEILTSDGYLVGSMEKNMDLWIPLNFNPSDKLSEAGLRGFVEDYIKYGMITSTDNVDEVMAKAWKPVAAEANLGYDYNDVDGTWWN